jgi:choline kinase
MQALIVAAGAGKRLGGTVPKPLIEINGKSLLINLIELFREEGIGDIVVITGHMKHRIDAAIAHLDVKTVFNPFYPVSDNLASFWVGRRHITGPCVLSHGDLIFDKELLHRLLQAPGDIVLPMDRSSLDEEAMKMKIVDGVLVNLNKFIPLGEAAGESIPIMKFSEAALSDLVRRSESILEEGYFDRYIDDAVLDLVRQSGFITHILDVTGLRWAEIDTREDLERAAKLFAESK